MREISRFPSITKVNRGVTNSIYTVEGLVTLIWPSKCLNHSFWRCSVYSWDDNVRGMLKKFNPGPSPWPTFSGMKRKKKTREWKMGHGSTEKTQEWDGVAITVTQWDTNTLVGPATTPIPLRYRSNSTPVWRFILLSVSRLSHNHIRRRVHWPAQRRRAAAEMHILGTQTPLSVTNLSDVSDRCERKHGWKKMCRFFRVFTAFSSVSS